MEEVKTSFEPSFELILANIGLIRKSIEIYNNNSANVFHRFFKDNEKFIKESIPEFKNMIISTDEFQISFYKKDWCVNDDQICFILQWDYSNKIEGFKNNPLIGLYVPLKDEYRVFNESLGNELSKNQNEILSDYSIGDDKDKIPRSKYIDISKYGNDEKFNSEAFLDDVIKEFKKLAQLTNTIDEILEKINPKKIKTKRK